MDKQHREWLKAQLRQREWSLARVARQLNLSRAAVSMVLAGRRSQRVEGFIAQVLGLTVAEAWPGRYPSDKERV